MKSSAKRSRNPSTLRCGQATSYAMRTNSMFSRDIARVARCSNDCASVQPRTGPVQNPWRVRVYLVPATPELINTELSTLGELGRVLAVTVPEDWPPEHHDGDALRFMRHALEQPDASGWWLHYVVADGTLVGSAGYKGPPEGGVVEIGYSIVPSWQRRGIATAACRELVETAWQRGARAVRAETLPELRASVALLERLGFRLVEPIEPGALVFELHRG